MRQVHGMPGLMTRLLGSYTPGLLIAVALIILFFYLNRSTDVPPP